MVIYCITNKINGKRYVGQTTQKLADRWRRHCWKCTANSSMAIALAIQKYGREHFTIEEVVKCSTVHELCEMEKRYIAEFNTLAPHGYNLTTGGERIQHVPETLAKIAAANRGKVVSDETRRKLSIIGTGRKLSPEHRARSIEILKGRKPGALALKNSALANQKTYYLIDPSSQAVTITNMAEFCRTNGLSKFKMCEVVKGKRPAYRGWRLP